MMTEALSERTAIPRGVAYPLLSCPLKRDSCRLLIGDSCSAGFLLYYEQREPLPHADARYAMYCPKCSARVPDGATSCPHCQTPIKLPPSMSTPASTGVSHVVGAPGYVYDPPSPRPSAPSFGVPMPAAAGSVITCASCNQANPPDSAFCIFCGTPLSATPAAAPMAGGNVCPSCGASNEPGLSFCIMCGSRLA